MLVHLRRSLVAVVAFTLVFGFLYALAGTGVAQGLEPLPELGVAEWVSGPT